MKMNIMKISKKLLGIKTKEEKQKELEELKKKRETLEEEATISEDIRTEKKLIKEAKKKISGGGDNILLKMILPPENPKNAKGKAKKKAETNKALSSMLDQFADIGKRMDNHYAPKGGKR